MLNHLGGGRGGIEHFFEQFTGPMTAWWKVLGSPELTPGRAAKAHRRRCTPKWARARLPSWRRERDEVLLRLLEARRKVERRLPRTKSAVAAD